MSRLLLFGSLIISLFITTPVAMAQTAIQPVMITLSATPATYKTGDMITMPLKIDTKGENIYSLQTDISFPSDKLEVTSIDTTGSVFALQVINTYSSGKIALIRGSFSPINTTNGLIATIQLKALEPGVVELVFDPTTVALNQAGNNQTTALGTILTVTSPSTPTPVPSPAIIPSPSPSVLPSPSVSPTPSPAPTTSTITIFAAGTPADGGYPTLALQIRNPKNSWKTVKTFTNVTSLLNQLEYKHPILVEPKDIRVRFTNDKYLPWKGQDRNLYVDKINLDGVDIQTERNSTFSVGSWSSKNGCSAGFKSSEWLHCNGYFEYR